MNNTRTKPGGHWLGMMGIVGIFMVVTILAGVTRDNAESRALLGGLGGGNSATETEEATPDTPATLDYDATLVAQSNMAGTQWIQLLTNTPLIVPTRQLGIIEEGGPWGFPGKPPYREENYWQNYIDEDLVRVYAGALYEDPTRGAVFVLVFDGSTIQTYLPSKQVGSIRVTDYKNNRLTLISTDGVTLYFDVPGRRFVESLTEVVPTITPVPPSPTPTITLTRTPVTVTPWPTCTPGPTPGPFTPAWPITCF